jgi:DNA polymerase III alpha subunit
MKINESYQVIIEENDVINSLLCGNKIKNVVPDNEDWVNTFNNMNKIFDLSYFINKEQIFNNKNKYITECVNTWYIPDEYANINVEHYLLNKCNTLDEINRVKYELNEYNRRNLYNLLRFLIYFVDTLRKNNILWGVGRGSSVSSYILYLIGIHRIDSLKYNLDIGEFLK